MSFLLLDRSIRSRLGTSRAACPVFFMAKNPKTAILDALSELETLYAARDKAFAALEKKLKPHKETYDAATAALIEAHNFRQLETNTRINALEKEVEAGLLGSEQPDGSLKLTRVESAALVAEAATTATRKVDSQKFFDAVTADRRDSRFWECVSIGVQKAEKFLGDAVNSISALKRTHKCTIRPKQ